MILELTKENLVKCGFDNEQITKLIEWDNYSQFLFNDTCYYATNIENKIYTKNDGYKKYYFKIDGIHFPIDFPDLIPEYFDLALKNYLDNKKVLLNTMFVEADQKKKFISNEIENKKNSIEVLKQDIKNKRYLIRDNKTKQIDILDSYISFLENKLNEQPQQNNVVISNQNFNDWLFIKPNWIEISFKCNTDENYKNEQNLVAVFWNSYIYLEQKFKGYFEKHNQIPIVVLNDLMFEFQQHFPKQGRIIGINYYDDLIELLIENYTNTLKTLQPQQTVINTKVDVLKNEYIEIFANDLGHTLFFELHNIYKGKKNKLANYSFVFCALQKEYLVCSGTDFINFLSKFDINIDKIDSRQSGTNNKTPLFNSILTRYSKNTIKAQ